MASFSASLKTLGDRTGLPATITLQDNRLSIEAGSQSIGEWALSEVRLERAPTGYRMAAEGEQILIELSDTEAFESELAQKAKSRPKISLPDGGALLKQVDRAVDAAERKWGALLPEWVFTRIMFGVVIGTLILVIALPGLISSFLLIAGILLVLFGAVVYTDAMLASRWLPGRMTPMHALLFGVAVLMLGILIGVVANALG